MAILKEKARISAGRGKSYYRPKDRGQISRLILYGMRRNIKQSCPCQVSSIARFAGFSFARSGALPS